VTSDTAGWDLAGLVRARAEEMGDAPYLSFGLGECTLTFREAHERSEAVAAALAETGVRAGDCVLLMMANRCEFVLAWFALAKLGAAPVPVNTAYRGEWLEHVAGTSGARTAVVDTTSAAAYVGLEAPALSDIVVAPATVSSDPDFALPATDPVRRWRTVDFGACSAGTRRGSRSPRPSDLAAIHFTSGTTGRSKGALVPLAHMDLLVRRNAELLALDHESVYLTELPLFHINAQMTVQGTLVHRCRGRIEERFSASRWLDRVRASGATHTSMLGVMVDFVLAQESREVDTDHHLGAAWTVPCVPAAVDDLRRRFGIRRIVTSYGTTEIGMLARREVEPGSSAGHAGPVDSEHYDVRIVDPDTDEVVPTGTAGEIVLRPTRPWTVMQGYVAMPERTTQTFRNLWLHTGDVGRFDGEGNLSFVDRLNDRIRRRGENVASADLEHVLSTHPDVAEVAVVAVPADEGGEDEIKACLVLVRDDDLARTFDPESFWAWCDERLPAFAVPRYLDVRDQMPRTATAKILKVPLREAGVPENCADRGPAPRRRV
jgi:carnitine-CoA ligase